jgi:hypothetical protein
MIVRDAAIAFVLAGLIAEMLVFGIRITTAVFRPTPTIQRTTTPQAETVTTDEILDR